MFEKVLKLRNTFLTKGASEYMVKHIMANIYRWVQDEAPYIPNNTNTVHEKLVIKAINDQNEIGWH